MEAIGVILCTVAGVDGILVPLKFVGDGISELTTRNGNLTADILSSELGVALAGLKALVPVVFAVVVLLLLLFFLFFRRNMVILVSTAVVGVWNEFATNFVVCVGRTFLQKSKTSLLACLAMQR